MAYLVGLLLAANLGERHVAWKWAAYAMLAVPAVAVGLASVLGMLLLAIGGRVGQVAGGVSVERQVAGTLILFVAGILAVGCLLPPVRGLGARLLRGFRADSALHAVSLGLYFGTLLAFISLQISTDQLKAITQSGESPPLWFIILTN
ncbi:MAG: hypothetical protein WBD38_06510, partial [Candidatus Dormiibacterota bacterium]